MFETITREYQYLYFYVDGNKKIPIVSGAIIDLSLVVFPHKGLVQKMVDDFDIKTDLFVWIDGTEFLVKTN